MTFAYPAVFKTETDGRIRGYFPDLAGIEVEAATMDEAVREARNAMEEWIRIELDEDEPQMPSISDAEDLTLGENETMCQISIHFRFYEGWDE